MKDLKDNTLDNIVKGIEAKLTDPRMKTGYDQIVVAGMKVLFSAQTHQLMLQRLKAAKESGNVAKGIVDGTVQLIALVYQKSKGKMYAPAAVPAATTLMCYIFDFAEKIGLIEVTPDIVASATKMVAMGIMKQFNVGQDQLAQGIDHLRSQKVEA